MELVVIFMSHYLQGVHCASVRVVVRITLFICKNIIRATKDFSIHLRSTLSESWTLVKTGTLVDSLAIPFENCDTIPYETFQVG